MRIYKELIGVESLPRQKLKTSNVVPSFIVCSNRNRSALVRDSLSYNSLFANSVFFDAPSMNKKCAAHVIGLLLRANNIAPSLSNNGCSVHTAMHGARARARVASYGCTMHSSMRRTLFTWSNHFRYMHGDFFIEKKHTHIFVLSIHSLSMHVIL